MQAVITQVIETLVLAATVLLFVGFCVPSESPFRVVWERLRRVLTRRWPAMYLGFALVVIGTNVVLTHYDYYFTNWVVERNGSDYTHEIHRIEGDRVAYAQALRCMPLTCFFAYAYVIVFPCMVMVSMIVLDQLRKSRMLLVLLLAYTGNYIAVQPFYFFFPVTECNMYLKHVPLLLDDLHPAIMQALRPMSGPDNCFPSFHTSLSVVVALTALRSGHRRLAALMCFFAVAIIFSTLYLGVHWLLDVAAGIVTGLVVYAAAEWLGARLAPRFGLAAEDA
jgi:membrane-associated phospholipid phosphatase